MVGLPNMIIMQLLVSVFFICDHMRSGEKLDPSVVINSGIRVGLSLGALH